VVKPDFLADLRLLVGFLTFLPSFAVTSLARVHIFSHRQDTHKQKQPQKKQQQQQQQHH
jgi:hypothetical protein